MTEPVPSDAGAATQLTCPGCGADVASDESFCEACGHALTPTSTAPTTDKTLDAPITLSRSVRGTIVTDTDDVVSAARPCASCGGVVGMDGYCQTCGIKAPRERDHFTERPSSWVAACCDRGIRHSRNEDATAIASEAEPGSRAVLVVCDGVSTSRDSDVASLAGARAARDVLVANKPAGIGVPASRTAAVARALAASAAQANAAVIDNTAPDSENFAACTFAAAVIEQDLIVFANVGDSRVYWVPDVGQPDPAVELSRDDSVAQEQITSGVSREEAEASPQAHAITKWLGKDSPDFVPRTGSITVTGPGWLLVCSDGLWNYMSEAAGLQKLVAEMAVSHPDPMSLAEALVQWACDQGGKDNVSVALARHTGRLTEHDTPVEGEV